MTVKLIACDLDGTLLLDGAQELRPDTCNYIKSITEMGIKFFAASGRQYFNLQNLFMPVKDIIGYICENGCISFLHNQRLNKDIMNYKAGQEIIQSIVNYKSCEVMVSGEKCCYVMPKDISFYYHLRDTVKYNVQIVPDIMNVNEPYLKIAVYEKNGMTEFNHWHEKFRDICDVVISGNEWIDMMPHNINKASALRHVLQILNIPPSECMAIGDNDNDREMLQLSGYPAAVKSAKPQIRAIAKIETDTVENLLARIIHGDL